MEIKKLDKALELQQRIGYTEREIRKFKSVREKIIYDKDEQRVIIEVWREFHSFYYNEWSVELRNEIIKLMLQTVEEQLVMLGKELIELEKQFDEL